MAFNNVPSEFFSSYLKVYLHVMALEIVHKLLFCLQNINPKDNVEFTPFPY